MGHVQTVHRSIKTCSHCRVFPAQTRLDQDAPNRAGYFAAIPRRRKICQVITFTLLSTDRGKSPLLLMRAIAVTHQESSCDWARAHCNHAITLLYAATSHQPGSWVRQSPFGSAL